MTHTWTIYYIFCRSLFGGINDLITSCDSQCPIITSVLSPEGEELPLAQSVSIHVHRYHLCHVHVHVLINIIIIIIIIYVFYSIVQMSICVI